MLGWVGPLLCSLFDNRILRSTILYFIMRSTKIEDEQAQHKSKKHPRKSGRPSQEIEQNLPTHHARTGNSKQSPSAVREKPQPGEDSENEQASEQEAQHKRTSGNLRPSSEQRNDQKKNIPELPTGGESEVYLKNWTGAEDDELKDKVLRGRQYDWDKLAAHFGVSRDEVIRRWQNKVYPQIRLSAKVANAVKWSPQEDTILANCDKLNSEEILVFLPSRSVFSVERRQKRSNPSEAVKNQPATEKGLREQESTQLSIYELRKKIIKRIGEQRRLSQQSSKPALGSK